MQGHKKKSVEFSSGFSDKIPLNLITSLQNPDTRDRILDTFLPISTVVGSVLFWDLAVRFFGIPSYLLPSPLAVMKEISAQWELFLFHGWITVVEIFLGFFASILIAVPLALIIVLNRTMERMLMPLLVMSQSVPKVAIAPLFVVWLGFGILPKVAVAFLVAFFPVLIATVTGLKSVEPEMLDLVRSMGATTRQVIWKVRVPTALPQFFSGAKISICFSVVGAIVGEFVGTDKGLGYLLLTSTGDLDGALLYGTVVILIILGIILFGVVAQIEKILIPWHISIRKDEVSC